MPLNKQQQAINAIENRNHNIIVPASAGTGKTFTMTNRIIEYLKEGNDIDNYLIVSFTEAAASELKERISSELKKGINPDNEKHFKNQLAKLPLAYISTIHSFCLDVIKKYGFVKNIDPAIAGKLGNEGVLKELKEEAIDKAIDYKNNNELIYALNDRSEDISNIINIVNKIDSFTQNLENYDKWKSDLFESYEGYKKGDYSKYPADIQKFLYDKLDELETYFYEQKFILNLKPESAAAKKFEAAEEPFREMTSKARKCADKCNFEEFGEIFIRFTGLPGAQGFKLDDKEAAERRKKLKEKFDGIVTELKDYKFLEDSLNSTFDYIKTLLKITEDYHKYYDELKKEYDLIDYQDMLNIALDILSDESVAEIYRNKFTEIMVDEYQDTNELQEKVIGAIKKDNNVFRVGDVKQSIYKFQNAKPALMKGLINNKGKNDVVLPLQYNYRSKANIRNFSNYIFNVLMNISDKAYDSKIDDLLLDPTVKDKDSSGEIIQLVKIPTESEDKKLNAKEKSAYISKYIANEICRLKEEKKDSKWSDFVILVRTNKYKSALKQILNERNIPVFTKAKTGFFSDEAVSCVISILKLILSNSRLNAFNVLTSSMFNYSYEDIAKNQDLLDLSKENNDKESLNEFIGELRKTKDNYTLSELLNVIYAKNDFYMEKIDSFQRSNLDSLYQMVIDYEKEDNNIKNLVSYLSTYKTVDREEANSFNNKDDVVQIMTIHQSKGLEFKYVFLADFFFSYDASKYDSNIMFNEKYGMAMNYVSLPYKIKYKNPLYTFIKEKNQYEDFAEELRVLYVAITRASEGLYIVGANKSEELELTEASLYNKSMMTWIETALDGASGEVLDLYDVKEISEEDLKDMNLKADASSRDKFTSKKFMKDMAKLVSDNSYSPSMLEDRYINTLNYDIKAGANRGTIMHKAIELLGIRDIEMKDIDSLGLSLSEEDKNKILAFYKNPFTETLKELENHHERTFIYLDEDGELGNGLIDLLSVGEDKAYIIDYKSDKNTTKEKLIERYKGQQNAYYKVVKSYYKDKEVMMYLYSFELDEYIEVPVL